ncbi:MAG: hypothetical protein N2578_00645 [Bdellovibrionaceae bacterium]|nr:hypothetical protein [Pseudobdellovibrionaceae bacterium]
MRFSIINRETCVLAENAIRHSLKEMGLEPEGYNFGKILELLCLLDMKRSTVNAFGLYGKFESYPEVDQPYLKCCDPKPTEPEEFTAHYRNLVSKDASVNERKQFVQRFVKKIEVGADSLRIHFIMDKEHYQRELALSRAGSRPFGGKVFLRLVVRILWQLARPGGFEPPTT